MVASPHSSQPALATFEWTSKSPEATEQFGAQLGRALKAGDVLALVGELGSGKTTLVRGLAQGLGLDPRAVKSPTFILLREYPGTIPLIHMDGYRLGGAQSAAWDDLDWLFSPTKVTVIEWAEFVTDCLPEDYMELRLSHKTTNQRAVQLIARGKRAQELLAAVRSSQSTVHSQEQEQESSSA